MPIIPGAATGTSTAPIIPNSVFSTSGIFRAPIIKGSPPNPSTVVSGVQSEVSKVNFYNYPEDMPKYYLQMAVSRYIRTSTLSVGDTNILYYINLPLPMGLIDNHVVKFDEVPFPIIGNILHGLETPSSFGSSSLKGVQTAPDGLNPVVPPNQEDFSGKKSDKSVTEDLINLSAYSPNQFLTIMLRGPTYKQYQFHWRFSPKTPSEAYTLNSIICLINNAMSPGTTNILAGFGDLFTFPNIFQLSVFPNSQYMLKFKPAILENFVVNLVPAGQPAFLRQSDQTPYNSSANQNLDDRGGSTVGTGLGIGGGPPGNSIEGVEISMQFLELEFWIAGDFKQTNNPLDGLASARSKGTASFGP